MPSMTKLNVTNRLGSSQVLGQMDPKVHMKVKQGFDDRWIKSLDSGNYQVVLSKSSGGAYSGKAYPSDLFLDVTIASGWGWPTSADSQVYTHSSGIQEGGTPTNIAGNVFAMTKGNGVTTFTR